MPDADHLAGPEKRQAEFRPAALDATFAVGDRKAVFQIHGSPAGDPVQPAQFKDFRCPSVQ